MSFRVCRQARACLSKRRSKQDSTHLYMNEKRNKMKRKTLHQYHTTAHLRLPYSLSPGPPQHLNRGRSTKFKSTNFSGHNQPPTTASVLLLSKRTLCAGDGTADDVPVAKRSRAISRPRPSHSLSVASLAPPRASLHLPPRRRRPDRRRVRAARDDPVGGGGESRRRQDHRRFLGHLLEVAAGRVALALRPPQRPPGRSPLTGAQAGGAVRARERQRAAAAVGHGEPGARGRDGSPGGGLEVVLGARRAGEGAEHRPLELLDGGRHDDVAAAGGARAPVAAAAAAPVGLGGLAAAAGAAALGVGRGRGQQRPGAAPAAGGVESCRGGHRKAVGTDGSNAGVRSVQVPAWEQLAPVS